MYLGDSLLDWLGSSFFIQLLGGGSGDLGVGVEVVHELGVPQGVPLLPGVPLLGGLGRVEFLLDVVGVDDLGEVGVGNEGSEELVP